MLYQLLGGALAAAILSAVAFFNFWSSAADDLADTRGKLTELQTQVDTYREQQQKTDEALARTVRQRQEAEKNASRLAKELARLDSTEACLGRSLDPDVINRLRAYRGEADRVQPHPGDLDGPTATAAAGPSIAEYIADAERFFKQCNADRKALAEYSRGNTPETPER